MVFSVFDFIPFLMLNSCFLLDNRDLKCSDACVEINGNFRSNASWACPEVVYLRNLTSEMLLKVMVYMIVNFARIG